MEFYYSLSDPLTFVIIGVCAIVSMILVKELAVYLRDVIPSSVRCWFCHFETQVHYKCSNSWICPQCEQYNGFKKDGGYNKIIQRQHDPRLNTPAVFAQQSSASLTSRRLCNKCNLKQEIKTQQLASFVPMNEKNYDKEVEHFQEQIEKNFELCQKCDLVVSKVLQNLREELSLPKRLTAAVLKIEIRGERAIYINLFLSLLLGVSSLKWDINSLPFNVKESLIEGELLENYNTILSHPWTSMILENIVQILIGTGIFINFVGFYQNNSSAMLLNIVSWVLMFFLTLYPDGFENLINMLKIASSVVSVTISVLILLRNRERRNKKKTSLWEKMNTCKTPLMTSPISTSSRLTSPERSSPSLNISSCKSHFDDSPGSISSGLSNLTLGISQRKELKRQTGPRPVITRPKFNPFGKSPSEKSYQPCGGKPHSFSQYEPSLSPASVYDGFEPVATIPPFAYQQPCYPCSPTLAYYFPSPQYPKVMDRYSSPPPYPPPSTSHERDRSKLWNFMLSGIPKVIVVVCHLVVIFVAYFKKEVAKS